MLVDEATRHEIHTRIEGLLGPKLAGALMSMLPNVDWDQVVLKPDLEALEERMVLCQEALEHRLGERIEKTAAGQTRWLVGTMVTVMLAYASITIYLVQTLLSRIPVAN